MQPIVHIFELTSILVVAMTLDFQAELLLLLF